VLPGGHGIAPSVTPSLTASTSSSESMERAFYVGAALTFATLLFVRPRGETEGLSSPSRPFDAAR